MDNEYELRYLPLFYEDMCEKVTYIREKLLNPEAADNLIDAVEEGEYGATMKILRGYRHLDKDELEEAERLFRQVAVNDEKSMKYYRLEASKELLFCMILRRAPKEEVDVFFDDELKEYLKKNSAYSSSSLRVLYAYDKLMAGNIVKAEEEYGSIQKLLPRLSPGDVKMEKKLLDTVKKCIDMNQNSKQ